METKNDEIKVSVITLAYNHEQYIGECINGIVSQQTNFKFELLINDDASTDNTANIIREYVNLYPHIIKPIYQSENQYSKKIPIGKTYLYPLAKGKYIALCEGDDYWIDPLKLQKQVDFMEANPEYGMCYTQARHYYQDKKRFRSKVKGGKNETFKEFIDKNTVPTLTSMFRTNLFRQYMEEIKPETRCWLMGDYPLWLWFAYNCKIKFIPEVTGVYRILSNSASHSPNYEKNADFIKSTFNIKEFFLKQYHQPESLINNIKQEFYKRMFALSFSHKNTNELKYYYQLLKHKNFKVYIKYWIRRYFW